MTTAEVKEGQQEEKRSLEEMFAQLEGVIGEIPRIGEDEIFRKHDEEMDLSWYSQPVAPEPLYSEKRFGVKDHSHDEQVQWDEGEILPDLPSDEVVARYSIQSDFGTMVHAELEAFMKGKEAEHQFFYFLSVILIIGCYGHSFLVKVCRAAACLSGCPDVSVQHGQKF